PFVIDPYTQHPRIDTEFTGYFGNHATRIDHPMRRLNLVLGRARLTLTSGHNGHPPSRTTALLSRCPLPGCWPPLSVPMTAPFRVRMRTGQIGQSLEWLSGGVARCCARRRDHGHGAGVMARR